MDRTIRLALILLVAPVLAAAADSLPPGPDVAPTAPRAVAVPTSGTPAVSAPVASGHPGGSRPARPLDLRLGDLRRYFTPTAMQSPLPEMIGDEVVVEGGRGTGSEPGAAPIPVGLVAPFWAMSHPLSAWRIFVPDPNAQLLPPPDPVPRFRRYATGP